MAQPRKKEKLNSPETEKRQTTEQFKQKLTKERGLIAKNIITDLDIRRMSDIRPWLQQISFLAMDSQKAKAECCKLDQS